MYIYIYIYIYKKIFFKKIFQFYYILLQSYFVVLIANKNFENRFVAAFQYAVRILKGRMQLLREILVTWKRKSDL